MTSEWDVVVRGGLIFDGTGGEPAVADLAVRDGRIGAIGSVAGSGAEEIDARGKIVTPGFIDIHTHYDAQATWDDTLGPSSQHGVTTAILGNCGIGFAPCKPEDRDRLVELMAGVEDVPEAVMAEGVPWKWRSFPEYLDFLASRQFDMDIAVQLPHSPLRVSVMGDRAVARQPATSDEIEAMAVLTDEAMTAGAFGFSTSRALHQRSLGGEPVPTARAGERELQAIVNAMRGRGVIQMVNDFGEYRDIDNEFSLMQRLAKGSGLPLSFTLQQNYDQPEAYQEILVRLTEAEREGLCMKGQVMSRPTGVLMGLELTFCPFSGCQTYESLKNLPLATRVAAMRKSEVRQAIMSEKPEAGLFTPLLRAFQLMFPIGIQPDYEPLPESSVAARAKAVNMDPLDWIYDALLEDEGRAIFFLPARDFAYHSLDVLGANMQNEHTLLGLGDGGAHYGLICDASWTTNAIAFWTRDRRRGSRLPLAWLIGKMTSEPANYMGLADRGSLQVGKRADVNVLDYERLAVARPHVAYDLPNKGRRLFQSATGYVATMVAGAITRRDDEDTRARPGRLARRLRT